MFRKHTNLVGQRICAERKRSGLSQEALAAQLYVTRQTISNWEVGKTMPDLESLKLLALALSVPIERLIYGEPLGFPVPWYQRIPVGTLVPLAGCCCVGCWAALRHLGRQRGRSDSGWRRRLGFPVEERSFHLVSGSDPGCGFAVIIQDFKRWETQEP